MSQQYILRLKAYNYITAFLFSRFPVADWSTKSVCGHAYAIAVVWTARNSNTIYLLSMSYPQGLVAKKFAVLMYNHKNDSRTLRTLFSLVTYAKVIFSIPIFEEVRTYSFLTLVSAPPSSPYSSFSRPIMKYFVLQTRSPKPCQSPQPNLGDQTEHLSEASADSLEAMSEGDSPTPFSRGSRTRASLPVVRSANQTKERSLGKTLLQSSSLLLAYIFHLCTQNSL